MSTQRRFIQCDVFTSTPTKGNALAVIVDAEGMSDADMASFARWTNLAETTFLFPPEHPDADYKVRIFTPTREMPFAGHPTLGSCAVWLHAGGAPASVGLVRQECAIGLVDIDLTGARPAFVAPPTTIEALPEENASAIIERLNLNASKLTGTALLNNGPVWQVIELASAADVLSVDSSRVRWPEFKAIGLIGKHDGTHECDYEVRMLAPSSGMSEDPITGSLNSALAHWLDSQGRLEDNLLIAQGTSIDRHGRVYISNIDNKILIGGETHILVQGSVTI